MKPGVLIKHRDDEGTIDFARLDESDVYFRVRQKFFSEANKQGVPPLENYVSEDPDYLQQCGVIEPDADPRVIGVTEEFFSPEEAMSTVEALMQFVGANLSKPHMNRAKAFLNDLHSQLTEVASKSRDFHLTFEKGAI